MILPLRPETLVEAAMNDTLKRWMDTGSEINERAAATAINAFDWLFRKESLVKSGQTPHVVIHEGDPMSVRYYDLDDDEIPLSDDTVRPCASASTRSLWCWCRRWG